MVLYPILLSQSWSTTVPNSMLVSGIAQSGQNLALSRLAIVILHFLSSAFFFQNQTFSKIASRYTIRVSNTLDSDRARPDLGPICLQRLSADDTSRQRPI